MPIKVVSQEKLTTDGKTITKDDIKKLMATYRRHTGKQRNDNGPIERYNKLKDTISAWFSLEEIIQFLKDNDVDLKPGADLKEYGIRIYFGMHHPSHSYQPQPRDPKKNYHFKDTPILVLTKKNGTDDEDQLHNKSISMAPFFDPNEGLDNARLCPPECNGGIEDLEIKEG